MTEQECNIVRESMKRIDDLLTERDGLLKLVKLSNENGACVSIGQASRYHQVVESPRVRCLSVKVVRALIQSAIEEVSAELAALKMPTAEVPAEPEKEEINF